MHSLQRPAYQTVRSHPTSARHPEGHLGLPVLEVDLVLGPHGAPLAPEGGRDPHLISAGDGIWPEEEEEEQPLVADGRLLPL